MELVGGILIVLAFLAYLSQRAKTQKKARRTVREKTVAELTGMTPQRKPAQKPPTAPPVAAAAPVIQPPAPAMAPKVEERQPWRPKPDWVPPPDPVTPGMVRKQSAEDAWEGSFWEATATQAVTARLKIEYIDAKGDWSERAIVVRQIGVHDDGYLMIAHCMLRNATRTFRSDRIVSCIDLDTGEDVDDVAAYLYARHEQSPERVTERLRDEEGDVLKILFFLGKADGQFRAEERAIVRRTTHAIVGDERLTDKMIDSVLDDFGSPSLQAFKLAVGRVARKDPSSRALIVDAARAMVATQKKVAPPEAEALDYIRKRLA